ncbi:hypothetical protein [Actinoplanes regularis]|uniref:Uncharacterized protein n=1 Tax=Actinoplanes regularis TaxID=52697 RepID=A0A239HF64_9ACTN|nr:hypothetical protein [Actinoplanes regularis]GIE91032.1 hypothetical protein Are01nite_75120 [Actinoplanes regularis]SNS79990.1 hypothetical protein SAMN06264365_12471 [Actinoplanes regularis]
MSDNPSRSGPRALLSGLAVGAVLGAPIAAVTTAGAEEMSAAVVERVVSADDCPATETTAATIREQFRASFAAGAVAQPATDHPVIC